jgi:hypothetical protein
MWQQALEHAASLLRFLVAGACLLALAIERPLDGGEIGQRELGEDGLDVGQRIDATGDMHHVVVFEAADDADDGIGFANVGEELVAQAFAFRGAGD